MFLQKQTILMKISTEDEYFSLSYMVKDILLNKSYILLILNSHLRLKFTLVINVKFYLKKPTMKLTKNIKTRYHFIQKYIKKTIYIEFSER